MIETIDDLILYLECAKKEFGNVPVIADVNYSPDTKHYILEVLTYTASYLEDHFNNPTKAKNEEQVVCIRIK